ncbi:putative bifunctional diguanylate cyclase/phosphodiesterase [Sphaerotilus uruguayifluvii]|uniref:Diguanylate cyclase (GGDEF)-like protein/PAS domain S-box-containing protein n=1 Tax=Sphaerotilus uruguayifluvii TaxID=2735897 RepID=A0ABX2G0H0_9BURK|nr:EAL domain-containing protein [Leptothrix sp. C29]NRT55251.1 diguanylate cyclase (GGDEF)-like protein/PAS domain S-box-containing protein [Leptothrix sp. C29]
MPDPKKASRPPAPSARSSRSQASDRRRQDRRRTLQSSDEAVEARVRLRQHAAVVRALPWMAAMSALGALSVAAAAPATVPQAPLWIWLVALMVLTLGHLQFWHQCRRQGRPLHIHRRRVGAYELQAALTGLLWSVPPVLLAFGGDMTMATVSGATAMTVLCAGSLTLLSMPRALHAFLGLLGLGPVIGAGLHGGLTGWSLMLQWLLLAGIAVASSRGVQRSLHARVSAEVKSDYQMQLVGLLLRDFEEQGSDVIWEIDAAGRLCHVSRQLADALGREPAQLNDRSLMGLLSELQKDLPEADRESAGQLHERLTEGQPFRDVMLPMIVAGQPRWWSMTAKPLVNERGGAVGWRGVARDVTQVRQADRRLAWLAHNDTLTGLTNRAHFRVLLEKALGVAKVQQRRGAVMCLDLDGFKNVNDTLGHATGDALLVEVARRLKEASGRGQVVARLGGDEFAVLMRSVHEEGEIAATGQRIIEAMRLPCEVMGAAVPVRVSIGIARFPEDGMSVDEMMQHADLALYDAKSHAPGSVRFFVARLGEQVRRRLVLERDLREAIERGQLELHFQPKVSLRDWTVTGFEALLRWNHPEHGPISPVEFIPVAEESGLILQMGEWALGQACMEAARWPHPLQVAVNISPVQVMAQNLPDAVQRALQRSGLAPHRLELEITESVFINETRGTVERLHALGRLGVQIALDDFGTGYSSLAYLRRFPFDTLKIDRAFVRELLISRDARSIVRNILALAQSLRMTTVAEGVEEPMQVSVLEAEGCDVVQGYYASRPIPAREVLEFVLRWGERHRPDRPRDFDLANTETAALLPSQPETLI